MADVLSGTLTLLFSDLEDSTRLLQQLGAGEYAAVLSAHRTLMTEAVSSNGGSEVDAQGDSFFCVFRTAHDAVAAAAAIQGSHRDHVFPAGATVRVRIGLHTGEPMIAGGRYVGLAVHRAARIMHAAHGGQVLASAATVDVTVDDMPAGVAVIDLGEYRLKGLERPEHLYELRIQSLEDDFPPPRSVAWEITGLDIRILGPLEIRAGQNRFTYAGEKSGALLALLVLNANRVVSIDQLIDDLWGDEPPASGVKAVQVRVSQLRRTFVKAGIGELIITRRPGYVIELATEQLDLHRFERFVSESDIAFAQDDASRAAELLRDALALWRGPPLAEFSAAPFARAASARIEELRLAAVERRIEADLVLRRHADVIGELESLIVEHPFRERLRALLMLALYRSGRQADALEAYRVARHELSEELGIEPSQSLQDLERRILQQDPGLLLAPPTSAPAAKPALWETPAPERSILIAPSKPERLERLLRLAEPLTKRPRRELILSALVEGAELAATTAELESVRTALAKKSVPSRIAAFTSVDRGADLVRLASEQDVDLILVDAPDQLLSVGVPPGDLAEVWRDAPCDVGVVTGDDSVQPSGGPVLVPFGGGEHDWAAVEIGAWLAAASGATLQLLGSAAKPERGKRDASRSLAMVSLVVQRAAGISAKPLLVTGDEMLRVARGASLLVLGLSERWSEEGLGAMRLALARDAGVPTLLVRRGLRPGGLTPPERMTRYTWSFAHTRGAENASGG
jgi:DNA-binding SARP family transcriptional activator/class 3 adenylate cyclase